jgi:hypothetical protein
VAGNLDFPAAFFVGVLTIGGVWVGMRYAPTASGPPDVPSAPTLTFDFLPPPPHPLYVTTALEVTGASTARLKVDAAGTFPAGQRTVHWYLFVSGFSGYECTKLPHLLVNKGDGVYQASGTVQAPGPGVPFAILDLCWTDGSPVTANGAYFAATLPSVTVAGTTALVTRSLKLSGNELAYQLGTVIPPSSIGAEGLTWQDAISNIAGGTVDSVPVFGSSIAGVQQAAKATFFSGVAFGVAGGAGVSLLLALPELIRRQLKAAAVRRKKRAGDTANTLAGPVPDTDGPPEITAAVEPVTAPLHDPPTEGG